MKRKLRQSSLFSALSLLVASVALPVVAFALTPEINQFNTPTTGSNPQQMINTGGGNIWFTEDAGNKIGIINTSTNQITDNTTLPANSQPNGIVQDGTKIFVAEYMTDKIDVFSTTNPTAAASTTITLSPTHMNASACGGSGAYRPVGLAIAPGPSGNLLWFTEAAATANCVGVMTETGTMVAEYPVPSGYTLPDRIIYANNQIWISGTGPGILNIPQSTAQNPAGCSTNCINHNDNGAGGNSTGFLGTTDNIVGLTYDSVHNFILFADNTSNKIGLFVQGTQKACYYDIPTANSGLADIAMGPDQQLWFAESAGNNIGSLVPNILCSNPTTVKDDYASLASKTLSGPNGIVASGTSAADGIIWFSESTGDKVSQLKLASLISGTNPDTGSSGSGAGGTGTSSDTTAAPASPNTGLAAIVAHPWSALLGSSLAAFVLVVVARRLKPVRR